MQLSPNVVQTFDQPEPPWRDALPQIACPILLITGDPARGGVVTPENAQKMAGLSREGKVVQFDGVGHMIHWNRYEPFVEAVQTFLAGI